MSSLVVHTFAFDDENIEKFASHGLTERQVDQVLDSPFVHYRNRSHRRADRLLIGRDHGGQCIVLPIEPTRISGVWRPVTAWRCSDTYEARLRKEGM